MEKEIKKVRKFLDEYEKWPFSTEEKHYEYAVKVFDDFISSMAEVVEK